MRKWMRWDGLTFEIRLENEKPQRDGERTAVTSTPSFPTGRSSDLQYACEGISGIAAAI